MTPREMTRRLCASLTCDDTIAAFVSARCRIDMPAIRVWQIRRECGV